MAIAAGIGVSRQSFVAITCHSASQETVYFSKGTAAHCLAIALDCSACSISRAHSSQTVGLVGMNLQAWVVGSRRGTWVRLGPEQR